MERYELYQELHKDIQSLLESIRLTNKLLVYANKKKIPKYLQIAAGIGLDDEEELYKLFEGVSNIEGL